MKRSAQRNNAPGSTLIYLRKHAPAIQRFLEIRGVWPPRRHQRSSPTQALINALLVFNAQTGSARVFGSNAVQVAFTVANRHVMHQQQLARPPASAPPIAGPGSTPRAQLAAQPAPARPVVDATAQQRCDEVRRREEKQARREAERRQDQGDPAAARLRLCSDGERFYKSHHWLSLRYAFLRVHGADPHCFLCHRNCRTSGGTHVDHIKPRSIFPDLALDFNNLQILCGECDLGKSNRHADDWRTPEQAARVVMLTPRR